MDQWGGHLCFTSVDTGLGHCSTFKETLCLVCVLVTNCCYKKLLKTWWLNPRQKINKETQALNYALDMNLKNNGYLYVYNWITFCIAEITRTL